MPSLKKLNTITSYHNIPLWPSANVASFSSKTKCATPTVNTNYCHTQPHVPSPMTGLTNVFFVLFTSLTLLKKDLDLLLPCIHIYTRSNKGRNQNHFQFCCIYFFRLLFFCSWKFSYENRFINEHGCRWSNV